jgi:O-antigen/teichoic acid export membrane protein
MNRKPKSDLTGGGLLARNTVWNLSGQILPMIVATVTVPALIAAMGVTRFGLLSLAWTLVGYFSLFDLGVGRALTKFVADKLVANEESSIPALAWTCLFLMLLMGLLGSVGIVSCSSWMVHRAFKIPSELQGEVLLSVRVLAASIPMVTVTSGLRGILDAQQQFRLATLIRIPLSVFSFAGPLLVMPFSHSLVSVMCVLLLGRFIGVLAHLFACFHTLPALRQEITVERSLLAPVLWFGGWMTVSNLVGPLMFYMDRFLIGALVSVTAVAYYAAPFDMVSRLTIIPGAVVGVLFPAFAVGFVQDPNRPKLLLIRSLKYIFLIVFPIVLVIMTLAPEGLHLWLGATFSQNGTAVLRWLAAGIFVNAFSTLPFVLIQSAGRPDIVAKLHSAELPVYLAALWFFTGEFGILGTAIVWTARITLDAALLFFCCHMVLPQAPEFYKKLTSVVAGGVALLYVATLPKGLVMKAVFLVTVLLVFALVGWFWGLTHRERAFLAGSRTEAAVS